MTAARPPQGPGAWLPYAGLMMAFAGIIYQSGQLSSTVAQDSARITKLEASDQARSDAINSINVRSARIEAKLDIIVPRAQLGDQDKKDGAS